MPAPMDDGSLMEEVRRGNAEAFRALYDRHQRAVFSFFLRFVGDRRAAEDLLQETFLRVFAHREDYRLTAAFKTWLFTIARNLLVDRSRRASARPESFEDELPAQVADPSPGPLAELEGRALEERLQAALATLPPFQREVVLLSRFAGLSHEEIAGVTGASPGAVRGLLFLLILAPYVIAECREFGPALEVAFVSGLAGGAVVSSLAGLAIARVGSFGRERLSAGGL